MTKKIFSSIILTSVSVILISILVFSTVLYNYFEKVQNRQLEVSMSLAKTGYESEGIDYFKKIVDNEYRITLIDDKGVVLYDSVANESIMENHLDREEILQAMEEGKGKSSRYSATSMTKTIYYAEKLSEGYFLRLAINQNTVFNFVTNVLQALLVIFILALCMSSFVAKRIARKIVLPLNNVNLDNPLENETYDEIAPLLSHIQKQQKQIKSQVEELKIRQNEFSAVTENMNEGLVLLNEKGIILSINPSAENIFDIDENSVGKDFLAVERNIDIDNAIEEALLKGKSEINFSKNGKEYQINISKIATKKNLIGVAILIFDVTEKVFAERNRKEFTANVSHELKSPLQSIMGSSELIEQGMVKKEDMPRFIGHIRKESERLLALIEDIIKLSRLDEKDEMLSENIDCYPLVQNIIKSLKPKADKKNISLSIQGDSIFIFGVYQLLSEIIFNLTENGIKYNKDGGNVKITLAQDNDNNYICVEDTGIGIPKEEQDRVFERFYRVDKSHSRQTGGTGLGLSIVKNSVLYLGGKIEIESEVNVGTKITVILPKDKK